VGQIKRSNSLSDGERQRVLIARALAQQLRILVLDEITAFLDLPRRVDAMRLLRDLAHQRQLAILLSSHDLDLSLRMADRIWLMSEGGRFASGAPEDLVLSGELSAAFSSESVEFDTQSGQFRFFDAHPRRIACDGDGVRGFWTRRALERAGFEVDDAAPSRLIVGNDHWSLFTEGRQEQHYTLEALVASLQGGS
jgi:iron complex transport system ATP-binding protein